MSWHLTWEVRSALDSSGSNTHFHLPRKCLQHKSLGEHPFLGKGYESCDHVGKDTQWGTQGFSSTSLILSLNIKASISGYEMPHVGAPKTKYNLLIIWWIIFPLHPVSQLEVEQWLYI